MWSHIATMVAIAVASNLDNAGVGIAYGVRKVRIPWQANLLVAVISGLATGLSGLVGHLLTRYICLVYATWIGAAVVIAVGVWVLTSPWRQQRKRGRGQANVVSRILTDPIAADIDHSHTISPSEAVLLGVALALNALAGGFDAGLAHIGVLWTALLVGILSFASLGLSAYVGQRFVADALGDKATLVAGLLLIAVGVHQVW
ncbi:MAG: manganese efflux pump [Alicyclobacillaceae bacterium]|nr:manganese efflux pump [Alicyclobacillaceae bacterium]